MGSGRAHSWPLICYLQTPEEVKLCDAGGPLAALGSEKDLGNSASALLALIWDFAGLGAAGSGTMHWLFNFILIPDFGGLAKRQPWGGTAEQRDF